MSKEFILAGKPIIFEGNVEEYNNLYWHFQKQQNYYVDSFLSFLQKSNNVDELSQSVLDRAVNYFSLFYKSFSEFYIAQGFIDFSPEYLTGDEDLMFAVMNPFMEAYYKLNQSLGLISDFDKKAAFNRDLNKALRGRVVGGGFGISGAAKGMLQAGAINIASGLAYDGLNVFEKMKADDKIKDMKSELHNTIRYELFTGYQITISKIFMVVLHQLNVHVNYDDKKAKNIISNIKNGSISSKQLIEDALIEALKLDPYTPSTYEDFIKLTSGGEKGIKEIAKYFRVDISSFFKFNGKEFDTAEQAKQIAFYNEALITSINSNIKFTGYYWQSYHEGNQMDLILDSPKLDISLTAINWCIESTKLIISTVKKEETYILSYLQGILAKFENKKEAFYQKYINKKDKDFFCKKTCQNGIVNSNNLIPLDVKRNIKAASYAYAGNGLYIGDLFPQDMYNEFSDCRDYEPYVYLKGNLLLCSNGLYIYDDDRDIMYFEHSWDGLICSLKCDHIWCGEQILVNNVLIGYAKTSIHNEKYPDKNKIDSAIEAIKHIISDDRFTVVDKCDEDTEKGSKINYKRQKAEIKAKRKEYEERKRKEKEKKKEQERLQKLQLEADRKRAKEISDESKRLAKQKEEEEKRKLKQEEEILKRTNEQEWKNKKIKEVIAQANIANVEEAKAGFKNYDEWSKKFDIKKLSTGIEMIFRLGVVLMISMILGPFFFIYLLWYAYRVRRNYLNYSKVRVIKLIEGEDVLEVNLLAMSCTWF